MADSAGRRTFRRALERAVAIALAKAAPQPDQKVNPLAKLGAWSMGIGIIGRYLVGNPKAFYPCVAFVSFGFVAWIADILFEKWKLWLRISIVALVATLFALFLWFVVWRPAPLRIYANSAYGDFPEGTNISGLIWKSKMSELRIYIENQGADTYDDVDASFRPSEWVREVVQVTTIPNVSLITGDPTITINTHASGIRKDGSKHDIYIAPGPTDSGFRMICPHFPSHSHI